MKTENAIDLSSDMFKSSFMIPQRYFLFKFLSGQELAGDYGPAWPEITALLARRDDHLQKEAIDVTTAAITAHYIFYLFCNM